MKEIKIALAGNPNVGKSTLFNTLAGTHQHVGNWPGKTIERTDGKAYFKGFQFSITDLPGTYSLDAYSEEEEVARQYLDNEKPDAIICITDMASIERTLYLPIQLIERGEPVIIALNMVECGRRCGVELDSKKLRALLGVPVIKIEAYDKKDAGILLDTVISNIGKLKPKPFRIRYGIELEQHIHELSTHISQSYSKKPDTDDAQAAYPPRWAAIQLLTDAKRKQIPIGPPSISSSLKEKASDLSDHLSSVYGKSMQAIIADARYGFINGAIKESCHSTCHDRPTATDRADNILLNRYIGLPIFFIIMFLMFNITFTLGAPLADLLSSGFGWLSKNISIWIAARGLPNLLGSFITSGIIDGVGSVVAFLPNILLLFMLIAILENSGYMARAVYLMDGLMHRIGLHGRSFIPLIIGFGCNVPAIMATRTFSEKKDKILTILINPLMSCSARLPIYVLFTGLFFKKYQGIVIFSIYLIGIILAIIMGLIFKRAFFKGMSSPLVMELPSYRMPNFKGILIHTWERGIVFIKKAGTIILAAVIAIWVLGSLPPGVEYASQESFAGIIGGFFAPIFSPLGFGTWQAATALLFGIAAKEIVVGILGAVYPGMDALSKAFTPLSAFSFMVTSLIYIPCIATIAIIRKEAGHWGWAALAVGYSLALSWIAGFVVYQGGLLLGFR